MIEGVHTAPPGRLIALGEIVGTHGVRGLLRLHPANEASAASAVDAAGSTVFLKPADPTQGPSATSTPSEPEARPIELRSARPHGRMVLLEVDGVGTLERATEFVGFELAVPETRLPPPADDEYYAYQLEGLEVVTVDGTVLGTVTSIMPTGSNDVLTVRGDAGEHLIPVIEQVIREVDLDAGRVTIEPIEGLLD